MSSKYMKPIKRLGSAAIIAFIISAVFAPLTDGLLTEEGRKAVLVNAVPFFAFFVGVLLLFILLIFIVALRYNGKVPVRTYRGIEFTIVAGILIGVICLFQGFSFVPYRYGFLLLLVSTLCFILWSHVISGNRRLDESLKPLGVRENIIGGIVALVVVVAITSAIASANAPREPYGIRDRLWKSYTDEKKAQIANDATSEFNSVEMPFLVFFSLFPAAIFFFAVREAVADHREEAPQLVPAAAAGD